MFQHKHTITEILIGKAGCLVLKFCPFFMNVPVCSSSCRIPYNVLRYSVHFGGNRERQFFLLLIRHLADINWCPIKGEGLVQLEHVILIVKAYIL